MQRYLLVASLIENFTHVHSSMQSSTTAQQPQLESARRTTLPGNYLTHPNEVAAG